MAKKPVEESNEIQFTPEEVDALRLIVTDWLNEGLMLPPYSGPLMSVLAKLELSPPERARPARATGAAASAAPDEPQFFPPRPNLG